MPRYQFKCKSCGITDVKQIQYTIDKKAVCFDCGEELERTFMRPPQAWFNRARQGTE